MKLVKSKGGTPPALTGDHVEVLISLLVRTCEDVERVKRRFEKRTGKRITLEQICAVQAQHKELIQEQIEKRADDLSGLALGSPRKQLRELKKIYDYAMNDSIVRGQKKVDRDNFEDLIGIDARLAKECVLAADKICSGVEVRKISALAKAARDEKPEDGESTDEQPLDEDEDDGIWPEQSESPPI